MKSAWMLELVAVPPLLALPPVDCVVSVLKIMAEQKNRYNMHRVGETGTKLDDWKQN
jgi:hypothetical protein